MTPTPTPVSPLDSCFAGVDVAKDKLDLATTDSDVVLTFDNNPAGHQRIIDLLTQHPPSCLVIESTGGLEQPLANALLDASINVALVNPGNVRQFANGLGILAKTDAIDARVLAKFAQLASPRLLEKRSHNQIELDALVSCRRQLKSTLTQQTNRRATTRSKPALKALDHVIKTLETEIAKLDAAIRKIIDTDDDFKDLDRIIRSVPGLGPVASATLIGQVPELGKTDRRTAPALLGVVPYNHDSGKHRGQRSISGGRTEPRCVLYMATITAIRCNPVIKAFADRLRENGKKPKVIITACMRKLVTILNAMLRERLEWNQLKLIKNP